MNPSEVDKGNQDEKKIAPILIKLDLPQADLEIPEGDEEEHKNLTCHR
jgi:hypothetical protein